MGHLRSNYHFNFLFIKIILFWPSACHAWRKQIQLEWLTALPVHSRIGIVSILRERNITDYFIVRKIHPRTQIQLKWLAALPVHSIIGIVTSLWERNKLTDYSIVRKIHTRTQIQLAWLTALNVHSINIKRAQTYRLLYSKKDKYAHTNPAWMIDSSECA